MVEYSADVGNGLHEHERVTFFTAQARRKTLVIVPNPAEVEDTRWISPKELAREIASKSPLAIHGSKVMINYARDHSIADGLDYVATWQAGMFNPTVDLYESFRARQEKRDPVYDDLLPARKAM